jgi:hypothetical protein
MSLRIASIIALLALAPVEAAMAKLSQCRPAADCTAADKPCMNFIAETETESLTPSPVAGAAVIRVRACLAGVTDVCPGGGPQSQTLTVFGYAGRKQIYLFTLNTGVRGKLDTGSYTQLPGLTRLAVRCNSVGPGGNCQVAWQICKEELPVAPK